MFSVFAFQTDILILSTIKSVSVHILVIKKWSMPYLLKKICHYFNSSGLCWLRCKAKGPLLHSTKAVSFFLRRSDCVFFVVWRDCQVCSSCSSASETKGLPKPWVLQILHNTRERIGYGGISGASKWLWTFRINNCYAVVKNMVATRQHSLPTGYHAWFGICVQCLLSCRLLFP